MLSHSRMSRSPGAGQLLIPTRTFACRQHKRRSGVGGLSGAVDPCESSEEFQRGLGSQLAYLLQVVLISTILLAQATDVVDDFAVCVEVVWMHTHFTPKAVVMLDP